jgi:hypothetical protein
MRLDMAADVISVINPIIDVAKLRKIIRIT